MIVERSLEYLGLDYSVRVVPKNKAERKEVVEISGQNSVPVLVDGEKVISDSEKIIQYLREKYQLPEEIPSNPLGISTEMTGALEEIKDKTLEALKEVGFGVLTEINVKETLKKKLGVDVPEQLILGACNPKIAHQAMEMEPNLGLLLPCNVIIRQLENDRYLVSAIHPVKMLSLVGRPEMTFLAKQVKEMLEKAISKLQNQEYEKWAGKSCTPN
ncbi:MAG: DUF302 domain-containing protein [Planctomycetota bacterium]|nr:MAG: DUF302 domain-containing protein [Planctomycetota bacterium]